MTTITEKIISELNTKRRKLAMPVRALSVRSGVSTATINRILHCKETPSFGVIIALANSLGISLEIKDVKSPADMRLEAAYEIAHRTVSMVQGSSALEVQSVDESTQKLAEQEIVTSLLAKAKRNLWGNQ